MDVSTGTGDLAFELGRRPGIDRVVGVDLLPEMIAGARAEGGRRRRSNSGLRPHWLVGDALSLPFADGAFSLAPPPGSACAICRISGPLLAEMARVLRPGEDALALLELTPMTPGVKSLFFRPYFHGLVPVGRPTWWPATAPPIPICPSPSTTFLQADRLAELLTDLGLAKRRLPAVGFRRGEPALGPKTSVE